MTEFYKLNLLGVERELPILPAPSGIKIAGFNPVGDTELITRTGEYMSAAVSQNNIDFDIILTTELKGVPFAQELARLSHKNYICLRKDKKCYMLDPVKLTGGSITSNPENFYISGPDLNLLKGKSVLFVDDVFSTGSTFDHIQKFAKKHDVNITAGLFVLREGTPADSILEFSFKGTPIICCGFLPLP